MFIYTKYKQQRLLLLFEMYKTLQIQSTSTTQQISVDNTASISSSSSDDSNNKATRRQMQ
jgi:hypothetical protein